MIQWVISSMVNNITVCQATGRCIFGRQGCWLEGDFCYVSTLYNAILALVEVLIVYHLWSKGFLANFQFRSTSLYMQQYLQLRRLKHYTYIWLCLSLLGKTKLCWFSPSHCFATLCHKRHVSSLSKFLRLMLFGLLRDNVPGTMLPLLVLLSNLKLLKAEQICLRSMPTMGLKQSP